MNGDWFPWSERVNGNASGQYAPMWRHVKGIFDAEGAVNVTWVWAPNIVDPGEIPLAGLYPGDAAVDWTGVSGYNWGTNPAQPGLWRSVSQIHRAAYDPPRGRAPRWGGSARGWSSPRQRPPGFPIRQAPPRRPRP